MRLRITTIICLLALVGAKPRPAVGPDLDEVSATLIGQALTSDEAYEELEELCDDIGHRLTGSASLERALDWAEAKMKADGLQTRQEPVEVGIWKRNTESLTLTSPMQRDMQILGLGWSVGTGADDPIFRHLIFSPPYSNF